MSIEISRCEWPIELMISLIVSEFPAQRISASCSSPMKVDKGWADMRITVGTHMVGFPSGDAIVAGSGGILLGEGRTNHEGRKAILLVRGQEETKEFEHLAETMGIEIIEVVSQTGNISPSSFFGSGRLEFIRDSLRSASGVRKQIDLVLLHTNATPRQLVMVNSILGMETWDRVRLLLALFTSHASSVEARTQVRIAQLLADRTVLREIVSVETTGERAGFGGEGATALQTVIGTVNRELATLRKRLARHSTSSSLRREHRKKQGLHTVGLVGYTNAGKSSLFRALSGKKVLIEDKLFSTLEPTIGQLEKSPRILIADTIGFIDNIPNIALASFKSTFAEALDSNILLHLIDASDSPDEFQRKYQTTQNELQQRQLDEDSLHHPQLLHVLSKVDLVEASQLQSHIQWIQQHSDQEIYCVSSTSNEGIEELRSAILRGIFDAPMSIFISKNMHTEEHEKALHALYTKGFVEQRVDGEHKIHLQIWISHSEVKKIQQQFDKTIDIK